MIGISIVQWGGSVGVTKCEESYIEFDFSAASHVFEHDTQCPRCKGVSQADGNSLWPGVDFRLWDDAGWIWLEVKNWRVSARNAYRKKMRSGAFAAEMREKFLGTAAYLAWRADAAALPAGLTLVFLFQPPAGADPVLRGVFLQLLRNQLHNALQPVGLRLALVDVSSWNDHFSIYPAKQI